MSVDDFRDLTLEFDNSAEVNLTFQRWAGIDSERSGIVQDAGFDPLVIVPPYVFMPIAPVKHLERLQVGDRQRDTCLLWFDAYDVDENPLNTLRTIEQVGHQRADRIIDVDRGLTYIVHVQWDYGRQARISGALGTLWDVS